MSHFTVLVIGEDPESQLEPFNEQDENYSTFVNKSKDPMEKAKWEYESVECFESPEGKIMYTFDAKKLPEFAGFDNHDEEAKMPKGWIRKQVPFRILFPTFSKFLKDWCGYEYDKEFGAYGYMANEDGKWDWHTIGGRWAGSLPLKKGRKDIDGKTGVDNNAWEAKNKKILKGRCDSALKKNIDWNALYKDTEKYQKQLRYWDVYVNGATPKTKEEKEWGKDPFGYKPEYLRSTYKNKNNYAKATSSFSTYAVLHEGEWKAPGDMGWFGCSTESGKEKLEWEMNFYERFIEPLPENTLITVVDCHV